MALRRHDDEEDDGLLYNMNKLDGRDDDEEEFIYSQDAPLLAASPQPSSSSWSDWFAYMRQMIPRRSTRSRTLSASKTKQRPPTASRRYCCCRLSVCVLVTAILIITFFIWGAFYFSPAALPEATVPDKSTDTSARILTLNIFMRPPGVKNNKSDYKEDRLDYIIKYILPAYDVIAIQEAFAFANRRIDKLTVAAREMGFNYQVASPRHYPWQLAADGGLLLLSRFPIKKSDVIEYPRGVHSDWLSKKGALHALVELNDRRSVHVYTSHTQASYDQNGKLNLEDTYVRLSQFALFHKFIADTSRDDGSPILLMGDFNVDASAHDTDKGMPSIHNSEAYDKMFSILNGTGLPDGEFADSWLIDSMKDAVYDQFGYHPVTFGNVMEDGVLPAETVLTHWDQVTTVQSLDRIFWADRYSDTVKLTNVTVEHFFVADNDRLTEEERQAIEYTQISDHYGLSCSIELI